MFNPATRGERKQETKGLELEQEQLELELELEQLEQELELEKKRGGLELVETTRTLKTDDDVEEDVDGKRTLTGRGR